MKNAQQDLTLLLMSGETSPVRRLRLRRVWFKRGAIAAATLGAVFAVATVDYVRLRMNAVDVERMRLESQRQREEVEALNGQVGSLVKEFQTLREFERKVRVIANLPTSVHEAHVPSPAGQGGADEGEGADDPEPASAAGSAAAAPADLDTATPPNVDLSAALERIGKRAGTLGSIVPASRESLEELVARLEDRREQLAATPSVWPANGYVTSGYGNRISPFTGRLQFHAGIDIAAEFGTPIIAPANGVVSFVGRKGPLGKAVVIDHGYGLRTTFGHTDEIYVHVGQHVTRGAKIASIGSTGRSTGPHVHYQVQVNGRTVDPSNYIFE
jgi:murein DD-endopeptidase MepM/ murein hydrolase activator NlpD